jgi:hypothetical protein
MPTLDLANGAESGRHREVIKDMSESKQYPYFAKHSPAEFDEVQRESVRAKISYFVSGLVVLIGSAAAGIVYFILMRDWASSLFAAFAILLFGFSLIVHPFFKIAISTQKRSEEMNEKFKKESEIQRQLEYQERIANSADLQLGALITMTKKMDNGLGNGPTQHFNISGGATNVSINANNAGRDLIQQSEIVSQDNAALADALSAIAAALRDSKNEEASKTFDRMKKEIKEGQDKVTIKALWKHLLDVAPDLVKLTVAVATISKLFIG